MKSYKYLIFTFLAFVLALGGASFAASKGNSAFQGSISVKGKSKSDYSGLAKISIQEAIASATSSSDGKVIEAALDNEDGFLVYEIELLLPNQHRQEILVDAGDGKILLTKEKKAKKSSKDDDDDEDED